MTVSCTPFDPSLTLVGEGITVSVEQAAGRSVAHGTGSSNEFGSGQLFPCDNTSTTIPVGITADTSGPPFHGGTAVVTASASAEGGIPCSFFPNCFNIVSVQTTTTGPTSVHMH
ncbi:MAG: hypothetical protein ACJ780_00575 [Solirubrobacteraceae bacterium]